MPKGTCSVDGCDRPTHVRGWCAGHYDRWKRMRDVQSDRPLRRRYPPNSLCSVEGCGRPRQGGDWCATHYYRLRARGDVKADIPVGRLIRPSRPWVVCSVDGCGRRGRRRGWCQTHWLRWKTTGDPQPHIPIIRRGGGHLNEHGYMMITIEGHPRSQHRWVMEQTLGRPLLPTENVHHLNGVRHDNRLENLEIWETSQPSGQRVDDKIKWALELIDRYPDVVARLRPPPQRPPV